MKKIIALVCVLFICSVSFAAEIKLAQDDKKIAITIDGKPFSDYMFADGVGLPYTRPFFTPVHSADGTIVTSDQFNAPPDAKGKKPDHPHHRSVWVAQGDVNGADQWAIKPDGSNPKQLHLGFAKIDKDGWVQNLEWEDNNHKPVLKETRTIKIMVLDDGSRAIDLKSDFTAIEDVTFGDTKEAGMAAVRMSKELSKDENVALSTGAQGEKASWGKAAKWSDIAGPVNGKPYGVAILDHPSNPRAPSRWHIRAYGLNGANIFGLSEFDKLPKHSGDLKLEKGKSLTFHYRIIFHESLTKDAKLDEKWAEFAK